MSATKVAHPILLKPDAAAERLGVSPAVLRSWARRGLVPSVRFGRRVRFRLSDVETVAEHGFPAPSTLRTPAS